MSDQSENKTQSEFLELYELYQQTKSNNSTTPLLLFDINNFDVNTTRNREYNAKSRKYTKEQIRRFLSNPELYERQIREVSVYLYSTCQEYKNLINYFSKMLTHDYILAPDSINPDKANEKQLVNNFYKNLEFIENYNIKTKLSAIETILIREDIYFAYERTDGENYVWQQLPTNYCRLLGVDSYETITFEFDFSYFTKTNVNIKNYASEFETMYAKYKKDGNKYRWQKLNPDKAICFKFDKSLLYSLPLFAGLFDELLGLEDYKDLQESSSKGNNYKLLAQKIPMKDDKDAKMDQFLLSDKAAVKFHNNVKANLPPYIGVVTTPMDIEALSLSNSKAEEDIVGKAQRNAFTSSGVSQLIFSSSSNTSVGLNRAIENDSSVMFSILRQFELWFKKRLRLFNNSKSYRWKLILPDITIFNREQMFKNLMQSAQYGYSKLFVSASLGQSQSDYIGLNHLENKQLKIVESMIPLQSSHTSTNEGGRPQSDDNNLADSGVKTRDKESNAGK